MKVYKSAVAPDQDYEWVVAADDADFERLLVEPADPLADSWTPIEVELVREDEGVRMVKADFPWLGEHTLIMRPSATAVVAPLVRDCAEVLPLATSDADLSLLHVIDVRDALDEHASDIVRFSSGRVMTVRRYGFDRDQLDGAVAFRVPQLPRNALFLTEILVDAIHDAGLTGFGAELVWEA